MVNRGEVALTDPLAQFLPKTVNVLERNGKQITLQDLATHKSALPRLPTNLASKDPTNPYADYTVENLYTFLNSYTLAATSGRRKSTPTSAWACLALLSRSGLARITNRCCVNASWLRSA